MQTENKINARSLALNQIAVRMDERGRTKELRAVTRSERRRGVWGKLRWASGFAWLLLAVPGLEANTTYNYVGNDFTTIVGSTYKTSDFVTASITLSSPLPFNSSLGDYIPVAFSLSDGIQTITNTSPGFSISLSGFWFATTNGVITEWAESAELGAGGPDIGTCSLSVTCSSQIFDMGAQSGGSSFGRNTGDAGIWSTSVPEPSTVIPTLVGAFIVLGMTKYGSKRRALGQQKSDVTVI